jgi:hypothetical protein
MNYPWMAIPDSSIPLAVNPVFQHLLDTYVSESDKVASTWKTVHRRRSGIQAARLFQQCRRDPAPSTPFRAPVLRRIPWHL